MRFTGPGVLQVNGADLVAMGPDGGNHRIPEDLDFLIGPDTALSEKSVSKRVIFRNKLNFKYLLPHPIHRHSGNPGEIMMSC
jgi:hypothetical protein